MPDELKGKADEAGRAINEAMAPSKPPEKKTEPQPENYEFPVDWKSPQGRRYHGEFKAHIMSVKDFLAVGILRAQLCGGVAPVAFDSGTLDMAEMVATITVVIDSGPDWAKDLVGLKVHGLIWEIYKEVRIRENRFQGRSDNEG
jgi:hypothetical protein